MTWILFALGCVGTPLPESDSFTAEAGTSTPADGGTSPSPPASPVDSGSEPRFQAHEIVLPLDEEGLVVVDDVGWTLWLSDASGSELCRENLDVISVTEQVIADDDPQRLAAWDFEVAGGEPPCSFESVAVGVTIARPDSRIVPFTTAIEAYEGRDLYSYVLRLDSNGTPTLHGVATTDALLSGDDVLAEAAPLPAGTYRLAPLIYLDLL